VATAAEKEELRGGIESTHNVAREAIENQYHADLKANEETKRAALVAAGLNSDGSDPQGRPTG
jgi:hypothetical protein